MQPQSNFIVQLIPMVLIFGIFYFLVIRPEKKKQTDHQAMLSSLKNKDEVITAAGIHGVVVNVKEKTVVLRLDENVRVEFERDAIITIVKKAE